MSLFILFVVGAVLLGAGAMLAPAWRTAQPRIALSATLALALVTGGSVWWAYAFGWDTLVVDYLLFALVSLVVLGGTLSYAQNRAEAQGEMLEDNDQGWPGPGDLLFFIGVGGLIAVLIYMMVLPQGIHGVTLGYLTVLARQSNQFNTLLPHADQAVFQAPGFIALTSYLSKQLELSIATVQFSVGGVIALLIVWLAYDGGSEWKSKPLGRAFGVAALLTGGTLLLLITGQYTTLLATCFGMAALICVLRVMRQAAWPDAVAGGLLVGAAIYADFAVGLGILLAVIGLMVWCLRQGLTSQLLRAVLIMIATLLFGLGPWLLSLPRPVAPLLLIDTITIFGWLIIPLTILVGWLLDRLADRLPMGMVPWLIAGRYPLLLIGLLVLVGGASLVGTQLRSTLPVTENDMNVLLWARTNLPHETVLQNANVNDWAAVLCECQVTLPPIALETPPPSPEVIYISERNRENRTARGTILYQQDSSRIVRSR